MAEEFTIIRGTDWGGKEASVKIGPQRELVTAPYGRYYEATKRGMMFHAVTPDAGVAPGTDSASTTAPVSLYNPVASGKDLVVVKARLAYVSGTLGAGEVLWVANTNVAAAATTGTAMATTNGFIGGGGPTAVGAALVTATLPAAPTLVRVFCSLDALLATSVVGLYTIEDELDGSIIVAPGATISISGDAAAGTLPLVSIGISWLEVNR